MSASRTLWAPLLLTLAFFQIWAAFPECFLYGREVVITNLDGIGDYDVRLSLDLTLDLASGHMETDCEDLRFYDATADIWVDHWFETPCGENGNIDVNVWLELNWGAGDPQDKSIQVVYDCRNDEGVHLADPGTSYGRSKTYYGDFQVMTRTSCGTGWTRTTATDTRFIRVDNSYPENRAGTMDDHLHDLTGSWGPTLTTSVMSTASGANVAGGSHDHGLSNLVMSLGLPSPDPPFVEVVFCTRNRVAGTLWQDMIVMLDSTAMPSAAFSRWDVADGRFVKGAATCCALGGSEEHYHTLSGTLGPSTATLTRTETTYTGLEGSAPHTHDLTTTFSLSDASSMPSYNDLVFAVITDPSGAGRPSDYDDSAMLFFADYLPPLGYEYGLPHNDFVLIRGAATPNLVRTVAGTHAHTVDLDLTSESGPSVPVWEGGGSIEYALSGHAHPTLAYVSDTVNLENIRRRRLLIVKTVPKPERDGIDMTATAVLVGDDDWCYGLFTRSPSVCSGNGNCLSSGLCDCPAGQWTGLECETPICDGIIATDDAVCSGRGTCISAGVCTCDEPTLWGSTFCEEPRCGGLVATDPATCNYAGNCSSPNVCDCHNHMAWTGDLCMTAVCYGINGDLPVSVCSGRGSCDVPDTCVCDEPTQYADAECQSPICFGVVSTAPPEDVCSGHGTCILPNNCTCESDDWTGWQCAAEVSQKWANSEGFRFMRTLTVSNPTMSAFEEVDVLVEFDSAAWLAASRLQSPLCDDIRFFTLDGYALPYYLESGCFTEHTSVWVHLGSTEGIPAFGSTDFLMYYGNAQAPSLSTSFDGFYLIPRRESCALVPLWVDVTDMTPVPGILSASSPMLLRAGDSVGVTGGADTHTHTIVNQMLLSGDVLVDPVRNPNIVGTIYDGGYEKNSHTHLFPAVVPYDTPTQCNWPDVEDVALCAVLRVISTLPIGSIGMFLDAPPGDPYWTSTNAVPEGYFLRAISHEAAPPAVPCTNSNADTAFHSHLLDAGTSESPEAAPDSYSSMATSCHALDEHSHTTSAYSSVNGTLPYVGVATKVVSIPGAVPVAHQLLFATNVPPFGWELRDEIDGRFVRSVAEANMGELAGGDPSTNGIHGHSYSFDVDSFEDRSVWAGGDDALLQKHSHTVSGTLPESVDEGMPPHSSVFAIVRKDSLAVSIGAEVGFNRICYGIWFNENGACGGAASGECVSEDVCACNVEQHYYGRACGERIGPTASLQTDYQIRVPYEAGASIFFPLLLDVEGSDLAVDCAGLFPDLDDGCSCILEANALYVLAVEVTCDSAVAGIASLNVIPLTDDNSTIVSCEVIDDRPANGGATTAVITATALVAVFLLVTAFIIVILVVAIMFVVSKKAKRTKARLAEIMSIEDIDVLMKEQELEVDDTDSLVRLHVDRSMFEIDAADIKLLARIGSGGSLAEVFKVDWSGQTCAFKCFQVNQFDVSTDANPFEDFEREVSVLASVSHPFILRFYGASLKVPRVGLVMEYCAHGDLRDYLNQVVVDTGVLCPMPVRIGMLREIASAMTYLHSKGIIHRDIKPENCLVTDATSIRLMDFGLSKFVDSISSKAQMTRRIGTSSYMAPEVMTSSTYSRSCDVFSFGILIFVVATQKWSPYGKGVGQVELKVATSPTFRPNLLDLLPAGCPAWLGTLCRACWVHDSEARPTFDEITAVFKEHEAETTAALEAVGKQQMGEDTKKGSSPQQFISAEGPDDDDDDDDGRGAQLRSEVKEMREHLLARSAEWDRLEEERAGELAVIEGEARRLRRELDALVAVE